MHVKYKKLKPEALLLRVIRVAEILAGVEDNPTTIADNGQQQVRPVASSDRALIVGHTTQNNRFSVR